MRDSATLVRRDQRGLVPAEKKMLGNIVKMFPQNPAAASYVMGNLFQYAQARHMYEWGSSGTRCSGRLRAPVMPVRRDKGCRPGLMPIPG